MMKKGREKKINSSVDKESRLRETNNFTMSFYPCRIFLCFSANKQPYFHRLSNDEETKV